MKIDQNGIEVSLDHWGSRRANVIASIGSNDANAPTLLFGAHLDVVPASKEHWKSDPFCPVETDARIVGRGAVDMLGGLCAAAMATVDLRRRNGQLRRQAICRRVPVESSKSCRRCHHRTHWDEDIQSTSGYSVA
ncbi:MAG: M20/M25/M40 family metallo-hydrolase [Planctomycetota bacterium]